MDNDMDMAVKVPMVIRQEAGKIVRTNSRIGTAEMLAEHLLSPMARRYRQGEEGRRKEWLYQQMGACYFINHQKLPSWDVMTIDTDVLDAAMMDDPVIANMTSVEIQDAFRAGVTGAYGDFYGISPKSLLGFLKSYVASDKKIEAHRLITMRIERENREANDRLFEEIQKKKAEGMFVPTWGPEYDFKNNNNKTNNEDETND